MIFLIYFLGGLFIGHLGVFALQTCLGHSYFPEIPFSLFPLSLNAFRIVIPAPHCHPPRRRRIQKIMRKSEMLKWIPAYAGMTRLGFLEMPFNISNSYQSSVVLWVEGITGFIFAFSFMLLNKHDAALTYGFLGFLLLLISLADLKDYIIPNKILFFIFFLYCFKNNFYFTAADFINCLILFFVSFFLKMAHGVWKRQNGLGWGDVKLLFLCGLWINLEFMPLFLVITGIGGMLLGFFWQYTKRGIFFPLGPAIAFSLWTVSIAKFF